MIRTGYLVVAGKAEDDPAYPAELGLRRVLSG
jgi:hypothetical protein